MRSKVHLLRWYFFVFSLSLSFFLESTAQFELFSENFKHKITTTMPSWTRKVFLNGHTIFSQQFIHGQDEGERRRKKRDEKREEQKTVVEHNFSKLRKSYIELMWWIQLIQVLQRVCFRPFSVSLPRSFRSPRKYGFNFSAREKELYFAVSCLIVLVCFPHEYKHKIGRKQLVCFITVSAEQLRKRKNGSYSHGSVFWPLLFILGINSECRKILSIQANQN